MGKPGDNIKVRWAIRAGMMVPLPLLAFVFFVAGESLAEKAVGLVFLGVLAGGYWAFKRDDRIRAERA